VTDAPYLTVALSIATDLVQGAIPVPGGGVTWEGDELAGEGDHLHIIRGNVDAGIYSGAAGISWFLGHLAPATGDAAMAATAIDGLRYALRAASETFGPHTLSLFSGASGVALAAAEVGTRLGDRGISEAGITLGRRVASTLVAGDIRFAGKDLIGGAAGVIVAMLALHRETRDRRFLKAANVACDWLTRARDEDPFGTCWRDDPARKERPGLCGMGHGVSGILWAIAETEWASKGSQNWPVVESALRYERSWFASDRCGWPDLRPDSEQPAGHMTAWCHGALGIGAVRLRLYEQSKHPGLLAEATAALQGARSLVIAAAQGAAQGDAGDVTLCHGLGGAVELMLLAYEVTGLAEHLRAARRAGNVCLSIHTVNAGRWTLGLRNATAVPGLFLGLSGIGAMMMRLHDPSLIGSPLMPGRPRYPAAV